jgi:hydroxyethylthiazole kinase-like uncharacterized protein yjeF
MVKPRGWLEWEPEQARNWIAVPSETDDKYSRGVLGMHTGSENYPGAAVLGVEGAMRAGVGMIRFLGPRRAAALVLQRRPEVVMVPGQVQAWLLGSGMNADERDSVTDAALDHALAQELPNVLDAGALDFAHHSGGPTVITPHYRELATLLTNRGKQVNVDQVASAPAEWAIKAAKHLGVTVLLKGSATHIASPSGARLVVSGTTDWLATAGTGDVLAGILGALVATHSAQVKADPDTLAALAATAALVQGNAAVIASGGGPIAALDVAEAVPAAIAALLA